MFVNAFDERVSSFSHEILFVSSSALFAIPHFVNSFKPQKFKIMSSLKTKQQNIRIKYELLNTLKSKDN